MRAVPAPIVTAIVIDTNIVLDAFIFNDPAAAALKQALAAGALDWLATQAMRDELERVLDYPQIAKRRDFYRISTAEVLTAFDSHARLVAAASKAPVTCSDADDQKFIDLAVAHQAMLLSKDKAVISMTKRLLAHGVRSQVAM